VDEHGNNFAKIDKWDCVVGSSEGPTDLGTFKVLLKDKDKVSSKYHAPMKYSLKFTSDYKAIHSTGFALVRSWAQYFVARDAGRHGCVGLTEDHAETLFNWAEVGTVIEVIDD
jgi:lipoprotein-anchoring transpeptidase ErfK/SrfK